MTEFTIDAKVGTGIAVALFVIFFGGCIYLAWHKKYRPNPNKVATADSWLGGKHTKMYLMHDMGNAADAERGMNAGITRPAPAYTGPGGRNNSDETLPTYTGAHTPTAATTTAEHEADGHVPVTSQSDTYATPANTATETTTTETATTAPRA